MNKTIKNEMYNIINEFKRIIKMNKNKIPQYYLDEDFFGDAKDKLDKNAYNNPLLHTKYTDLLQSFGKFINKYETDIDYIKKSILDKINEYCRLNELKKSFQ